MSSVGYSLIKDSLLVLSISISDFFCSIKMFFDIESTQLVGIFEKLLVFRDFFNFNFS